jgi:hypothetical protein
MTESNPLEPHRADRDLKVANAIRELLEREFPATDTPPRQRRTGRNVQLNIKATAEVVERFVALSDRRRWRHLNTHSPRSRRPWPNELMLRSCDHPSRLSLLSERG